MRWDEFCDLVGGLTEQTPLVRVAQIRTESDPEALRRMTPEQRRERAGWQRRRALSRPAEEVRRDIEVLQRAMAAAFGSRDTDGR